jgi:hypothetical protein
MDSDHPRARLADVKCIPYRFKPGDRVLVNVHRPMDRFDLKKIRRTVERWAGSHVEVLVMDCTQMEMKVEQQRNILREGI